MRRERVKPRADWRARCEEVGFHYHSMGGTYWDESACYAFEADAIDHLEAVSAELHQLCLAAVEHVVAQDRLREFAIPQPFRDVVRQSWQQREKSLFGRFDFSWDGRGEPKLLEYNADTPTSLLEASVVQWHWLEDTHKDADQFNSLHEKLIERWKAFAPQAPLYLACVGESEEDLGNTEYLRDCALQAGWDARHIFIDDLGWSGERFVDLDDQPVENLFKLYPWEWLVREEFGMYISGESHLHAPRTRWIEPAWKMLLSNKALLVVLWELNYGHPNLLPAYFDETRFAGEYAKKPLLSREGSNVTLKNRFAAVAQPGEYGEEGFVYQGLAPLPQFEGPRGPAFPVIGSWIVGEEPAGMGIREDDSPITQNSSRFVPHYFT